jgi:hypothetical protein
MYSLAIAGSQRILFSSFYGIICLFFLVLSFYYINKEKEKFNTLLIFSIFLSIDNGAGSYTETTSIIRYTIYLVAIIAMLYDFTIRLPRLLLFLCFLLPPILITIYYAADIDITTIKRDMLILLIISIVLCRGGNLLQFKIDLSLLSKLLLAYILGEYLNILFFFENTEYGYLSYDSTKSLIVLPALYYLQNGKRWLAIIFISLLSYVLLLYATRMIILIFISVLALHFLSTLKKAGVIKIAGVTIISSFFIIAAIELIDYFPLHDFKFTHSLALALDDLSLEDALLSVDYIRYHELQMFLDRNWLRIIFGDGFGSGIYDISGAFNSIGADGSAFSAEELTTKYYYNFHDIWVDVGLRFGLILLLVIFVPLLTGAFSDESPTAVYSMLLIILLCCAFFSSAGLILIAMFGLALRESKQKYNLSNKHSASPY